MIAFGWIVILIVIAVDVATGVAVSSRRPSEGGAPRGFPWLMTLFALVVVAGIVTFIVYQSRPANFVLEIFVPSGKRFIGEVVVDGRPQPVDGERTGRLEFTAKHIAWVILKDHANDADSIRVQLIAGAGGMSSSPWGARGFSEQRFLGGGSMFTSVNEDEWRWLMAEFKQPDVDANAILPGFWAPSNPAEGGDEADEETGTQEEPPESTDEADESETPDATES